MTLNKEENPKNINVLELRNYLLQPNSADRFSRYFHSRFVALMSELGGHTLGEFKINGVDNRFVWLRGFSDMNARLKFLNDFYISIPAWKEHGHEAYQMMINSDNVYLLKPLHKNAFLKSDKASTVIDFTFATAHSIKQLNCLMLNISLLRTNRQTLMHLSRSKILILRLHKQNKRTNRFIRRLLTNSNPPSYPF
jgi:hypothetical protein